MYPLVTSQIIMAISIVVMATKICSSGGLSYTNIYDSKENKDDDLVSRVVNFREFSKQAGGPENKREETQINSDDSNTQYSGRSLDQALPPNSEDLSQLLDLRSSEDYEVRNRRSYDVAHSQPVCSTQSTQVSVDLAYDLYGVMVRVVRPVSFNMILCDTQNTTGLPSDCPTCCRGIDRTRYNSECTQAYSLHAARVTDRNCRGYYCRESDSHVRIPSGCQCRIDEV